MIGDKKVIVKVLVREVAESRAQSCEGCLFYNEGHVCSIDTGKDGDGCYNNGSIYVEVTE